MNIYKNTAFYLLLAVLFACNDPDIIGLDLPGSETFTITNDSIENFTIKTISEDSLRSDESQNLLLGQINDPIFGDNKGSFCTQMLLPYNNINTIDNIVVDSVFLTYSISDHYGDLNESEDLQIAVYQLSEDIYKDSNYYSNESFNYSPINLVTNQFINEGDSTTSSYINIQLENSFGEMLINETGGSTMVDDISFLEATYLTLATLFFLLTKLRSYTLTLSFIFNLYEFFTFLLLTFNFPFLKIFSISDCGTSLIFLLNHLSTLVFSLSSLIK